ncbi:MAG: Ureidoglycolate lyase [Alphaproteobacteria bacterium MarineAlpha11_Bin1]|nr:MAG: Ureidoglycolate lyase [Alphaproteobacteria bacterium MarineAlpha11_Bin1]
MKIISYRQGGREAYGVVKDGGIVDMTERLSHPSLKHAIAGLSISEMEKLAASAAPDVGIDDIDYMFPVTSPEKIFCIGRNYRAYHEVLEDGGPKWPSIFPRFASSFASHGEAIIRPTVSEQLDYEGEIGVIIGKSGRHIPETKALDYVAGYTIINEGSVRDWQRQGTQNCPGKNFHKSGSIGPWMITRDEIEDLDGLQIKTSVDGSLRQDGSSDMMIFKIPFVISYISKFTWLEPGDMIATGSPGGSAIEGDPPQWLRPSEQISVNIEPIGTLKNPIVAE